MSPQDLAPIDTAHLFSGLADHLHELLRSLTPEEWDRPTIAGHWTVKQVAAHLLDTQLRRLERGEDSAAAVFMTPIANADLIALVDRLNREGLEMYGRLSPNALIALLESNSAPFIDLLASLDPFEPGLGVSWAGEAQSQNWFDTAREYTERWHHQQQIRLAVGKPGIMTRELYFPVLDCFMRALPHHYRAKSAPPDSLVTVVVSGDCGGSWYFYREGDAWRLIDAPAGQVVAQATLPQDVAWRVFTKGIDRAAAEAVTAVTGNLDLGCHILSMLSIVG